MTTPPLANRKLVLKMSVSLDGFVCGPDGEADWIFRSSGGPDSTRWLLDTLGEAGVHIMGSRTWADMAAFWPFSQLPIAAPMNGIPKVVFSRTGLGDGSASARVSASLLEARSRNAHQQGPAPSEAVLRSWAEPMVARGTLEDEIARLKSQPGGIILAHGGVAFGRSLAASGLVDEYRLAIHPVVLGQGQALFSNLASPRDLRLVGMTPFASGAVAAVYQPA